MVSEPINGPEGKDGLFKFKILEMNMIILDGRRRDNKENMRTSLRTIDHSISSRARPSNG